MSAEVKYPPLTFDEASHVYKLGDRKLPGITSRLVSAGLLDASRYTAEGAARGTAVHLATQYHDEGDLDVATLAPHLVPYLDAWERFKTETGWQNEQAPEFLVASPSLGYATKIDRVGRLGFGIWILNIKTAASPAKWWPIQLAGEATAYAEWTGWRRADLVRASLQLLPDGTYRLTKHENRHDYDVWQAAAVLAAWKDANGIR